MRVRAGILAILAAVLASAATPAFAVQPGEVLADAVLEKRAREISAGLRCLICQNQSIDDSDAPLAGDLRRLVRERLSAHDSDQQVIDYVVARYGDFVLLKPPLKTSTLLLWLTPILVLAGGLILMRRSLRGRAEPALSDNGALTPDERAKLSQVLGSDQS